MELIIVNPRITSWLISLAIIGLFVALAYGSRFFLGRIVAIFSRRTRTTLDDRLVQALGAPIFIALIFIGLWISLGRTAELTAHIAIINKTFISVFIIIAAIAAVRMLDAILIWYGTEVTVQTHAHIDKTLIPLLRRVGTALILVFSLLIILQKYTDITPLIAGLGIGGIAVALALQPTLSNFLAGTYVVSDGVIHKGDYIQLDNGQEGYVEEIGWRTTRLRTWQGNLVIMPNSRMAEAMVTDFEKPDASLIFSIDCGVSYDSDLKIVETVTLIVAKQMLQELPQGAKDFSPSLRFKEFAESNINFTVILKSINREGHFILKHEFIKALWQKFKEEGIEIQYPVRKLFLAKGKDDLSAANPAPQESQGRSQ